MQGDVDPQRSANHRRGATRRLKNRLQPLFLVLGGVALVLGLGILLSSFTHTGQVRQKFFTMGKWYSIAGTTMLALVLITRYVSDALSRRKSATWRRRYKRQPMPGDELDRPPAAQRGSEGVALVFVLIMMALIAALVVQVQLTAHLNARRSAQEAELWRLERAAGEAVRDAIRRLADDADLQVDSTNDTWFATEDLTTPSGISLRTTVKDENRFFDVNNIVVQNTGTLRKPDEVMMDLMTLCGDFTPAKYVDALTDWLDEDSEGARETDYYQRRDPPGTAANRLAHSLGDLLLVRKPRLSNVEAFQADLLDCITVLPVARRQLVPVNINTADREVLNGIFGLGNEALADTIVAFRTINPIRSLDQVQAVADNPAFERALPFLDVKSSYYRIEAQAYEQGRQYRVRALVHREASGRVRVIQWLI